MVSAWWLLVAAGAGVGIGMFLFALLTMAADKEGEFRESEHAAPPFA